MILFRATGAEGALVHLAPIAKGGGLRELGRPERTGKQAVAATDAEILVVQHDTVVGVIEAVGRADRHAGSVGAVHAGDRDGGLPRQAVVEGHHPAALDAPLEGIVVLVLARRHTAVALDAALGVTHEFHSGHGIRLLLCENGTG